jgi:hypothetical protein
MELTVIDQTVEGSVRLPRRRNRQHLPSEAAVEGDVPQDRQLVDHDGTPAAVLLLLNRLLDLLLNRLLLPSPPLATKMPCPDAVWWGNLKLVRLR